MSLSDLATASRITSDVAKYILAGLAASGLVILDGPTIKVPYKTRLSLALEAIVAGVGLERVCRAISSKEFEDMAAIALRANGFGVLTRFVFRHASRRYEIDVVGTRGSTIICADCKHWRHGSSKGRLLDAVKKQVQRVEALALELEKHTSRLKLAGDGKQRLIPVIFTLADTGHRMIERVPIVSVLTLSSFLHEFDLYLERLRVIGRNSRGS
jgi:Holliday junction resolvase-like predicted endonuclease